MAEEVFIIPNEGDYGPFPLPATSGFFDEGGAGGSLLGLLLPLILLATFLPGLIQSPTVTTGVTTGVTAPTCPVCAAAVTCTTPAPCVPTPTCPTGFMKLMNGATEVPNKCYMFLTTVATFIEQLQICTKNGGTLANPMTDDEGLALKTYLQTNSPNNEFYLGYTDLGNSDTIIALSGGATTPIPGLGENAAESIAANTADCTTVSVTAAAVVTATTPICTDDRRAVCEVNLLNQKCVCP